MPDPHRRTGLQGSAPKFAIGAAIVALLTSVAAVIVVASRGSAEAPARASVTTAPIDRRVAASDVTKLKRDVVEKVSGGAKAIGVKVTDPEVRAALGLDTHDVITAIAGRAIKREFDVYDAVLGMSMMDTSIVYVELVRDRKPVLVRWQLDGDLRFARRADTGMMGGAGVVRPPDRGSLADPLLDTFQKIDELHYEVPRSTIERLVASWASYARGARIIPAGRGGGGLRLYAVRPGSVFGAAGFMNGDKIRRINDHELGPSDGALELYQQIKDEREWRFAFVRDGRPETLTITIK